MDDWSESTDRTGDPMAVPRRSFLELGVKVGLAAGVGAAALGTSAAIGGCERAPGATSGSAEGLPELLRGLEPGTAVDGWTVIAVHPIRHGGIPVVLEAEGGDRFQVDIMARDPQMPGIADSEHCSLFVANAGDGRRATEEHQGLGAMALAAALRERERAGAPLPALWTMSERTSREPDGAFRVPLT